MRLIAFLDDHPSGSTDCFEVSILFLLLILYHLLSKTIETKMKIFLFVFTFILFITFTERASAQEGSYKIGKEIYVIEKVENKLTIRHEESTGGWKLTKPYDVDGKIGFDAINSGGIIEFWLIFDDDTYQTGIMERKYGQKNLKIKKFE